LADPLEAISCKIDLQLSGLSFVYFFIPGIRVSSFTAKDRFAPRIIYFDPITLTIFFVYLMMGADIYKWYFTGN